ncbi:MAG TPA: FAD-dependent oxidoreductase [Streptosporangiaceae bacterium]|jgi:3-phenylpropionate/trans-cinnamate dioxygenase ferredoxin reductase subunit
MSRPRYVLVGGGVAAASAAAELRDRAFDGEILLVTDEPRPPYERPPLSKGYLAGAAEPGGFDAQPPGWYAEHDVDLRTATRVTEIDVAARTVALSTGERHGYDALVLATGARPRRLPGLPEGERVHYLRTLADAERLRPRLARAEHVVVAGAGFIGCEVAAAAVGLGAQVTIFDPEPVPLRQALGPRIGAVITEIHRAHGVDVRTGDHLTDVRHTREGLAVTSVLGHRIECDLIVVGVGCEPNVELAADAGLPTGNGILVDAYAATAAPDVYAIGDAAGLHHPRYGRHVRVEHHDTAQRQGRRLAANLTGQPEPFTEVPWFWSDQYDHTLQMLGRPRDLGDLVFRGSPEDADFSAFSLADGRIEAVITLNRPRDVIDARRLIAGPHHVTPEQLKDESIRLKRLARSGTEAVNTP